MVIYFRQTDTVPIGHFLALHLKTHMCIFQNIVCVVVVYNHDLIKVIVVIVVVVVVVVVVVKMVIVKL